MPISEYLKNLRSKVGHEMLLVPGVLGVVFDDQQRVLLMQSSENGKWYLPGGIMDPGEQPADAICREVLEETGVSVEPMRLISVGLEDEPTVYVNDDVVWYVSICFQCRIIAGMPTVNDDEAMEVRFVAIDELPPLHPAHRQRIEDARAGGERTIYWRWKAAK